MTSLPDIAFTKPSSPKRGTAVIFADETLATGATTAGFVGGDEFLKKAAAAGNFTGKANTVLDLIAPAGIGCDRLVVVGLGKAAQIGETDWLKLGGTVMGALQSARAETATVILEAAGAEISGTAAADFASGLKLRAYTFDKYKTKKE